jgi:DNA-binding response OmpR family regulator
VNSKIRVHRNTLFIPVKSCQTLAIGRKLRKIPCLEHNNFIDTMIQNRGFSIALVEDESCLRIDLAEYLQLRGYAASGFESAEMLYQAWPNSSFDLVILDIGLPGDNGLQAAKWLRAHSKAGIVILTAHGSQTNQLVGLEAGADAYLVKNTSLEVIEATCRSVLRRLMPLPVVQGWHLRSRDWQLKTPAGEEFTLTHTETVFMQCLLRQTGKPVSRADLLAAMGKTDTLANLRNLDNCASRLRRKILKGCGLEIPIRPSYGGGYTFTGEGGIDGA